MTSRSESGNGSTVPGSYSTTWDYDTLAGSACGVKGVGKLCRVTGSGATRDFRYDKFSRPMSSKLTVAGESTAWESFSAYDAMSRVREIVYPVTGSLHHHRARGRQPSALAGQLPLRRWADQFPGRGRLHHHEEL